MLFTSFLLAGTGAAGADGTMQVAGKILQIGIGPRGVAMGEAQVAAVDDIYGLYWNPAALARSRRTQITMMHNSWFGDILSEYLAYAQPFHRGGFGIAMNYIHFGEFQKYGIDANNYPVPQGGTFTPFSLVTSFGYALHLSPRFYAGANLKLVSESVDTYNNITLALDLGAQYRNFLPDVDLGLTVVNAGLPMQGFGLPLMIKGGVAYRLPFTSKEDANRFLMALDGNLPIPTDQPIYGNFGLEYTYDDTVALRVGYKLSELNDLGGASGLTAGLGGRYQDYALDYAFASFGDLGYTHRVAFTVSFGEPAKKPKRRRAMASVAPAPPVRKAPSAALEETLAPSVPSVAMARNPIQINVNVKPDPEHAGRLAQAEFEFVRQGEVNVKKWTLKIQNGEGRMVRGFTGKQLPRRFLWDGKDGKGKPVPGSLNDRYVFGYILEDGTQDVISGRFQEVSVVDEMMKAAAAEQAKTAGVGDAPTIRFEEGSAILTPEAEDILSRLGNMLELKPFTRIVIEGYTDAGPEKSREFVLSQRRADTVARFLSIHHKVPLTKIAKHARGSKQPVATGEGEEAQAANRRVEIKVTYPR